MNKTTRIIIVVLGLLAFVLLATKTSFFAAIVTTCNNAEPKSLSEFTTKIDALNGSVNREGNLNVQETTGLVSYPLYRSASKLGSLYAIDVGNQTCSSVLLKLSTTPISRGVSAGDNVSICTSICMEGWALSGTQCVYDTCYRSCSGTTVYNNQTACETANNVLHAEFTLINQHQVLSLSDGYYWCNKEGTMMLYSPKLTALASYYAQFETCTTKNTDILSKSDCNALAGDWIDNTCMCGNKVLQVGTLCQLTNDDISKEEDIDAPINTTTPNVVVTTPPEDLTTPPNYTMWIIVGGVVLLFVIYMVFERGPKKGLFKKR